MTQFELFTLVYYALDAAWEENQDQELGEFLSAANPFLFKDVGSADPLIYEDFCTKITNTVPIDDSYSMAKAYLESLGKTSLIAAFSSINEVSWLKGVKDFLNSPHKQ